MADFGRVVKTFHEHPKAIHARSLNPGSISLWLFANCWCRQHRKQGIIPKEEAFYLGSAEEVEALLESGLWSDTDDGYVFHDWQQWNPDDIRNGAFGSATWLVHQAIPDHPFPVRQRLAVEVQKLVEDGVTKPVIETALKTWASRPEARVTWLAYYVSDAIRQGETGLCGALKEARKTWNMAPLTAYGYHWQAPDPPSGARSVREVREFMQARKREWLDWIEAQHGKNTA